MPNDTKKDSKEDVRETGKEQFNEPGKERVPEPGKGTAGEAGKNKWDKWDVILKPVGGLLTALAVGLVGFFGTRSLERNQARDTDSRLYAQLMSQREQAETSLRKDMFNTIIGTFLTSKSAGYEQRVLNLELLVYNFHEALDLAPLFKTVYAEVKDSKKPNAEEYLQRLEDAADEVKSKQIAALEDSGGKLDASVDFELATKSEGEHSVVLFDSLSFRSEAMAKDPILQNTSFKVEVLEIDQKQKRMRVKLLVSSPRSEDKIDDVDETYAEFWISPFDFPMIDNTRLTRGHRCALVLRRMREDSADLTLVYFPGSRASLKEKPFYDEAMSEILGTRMSFEK